VELCSSQPGDILAGDNSDEIDAVALIAGTTIGAGVLALPNVSFPVGFLPSTIGLLVGWLSMLVSSLLIAEVSTNLVRQDKEFEGKSYLSMISELLGRQGELACVALYIVLHYALLVAYDAGAGDVISRAFGIGEGTSVAAFSVIMGAICGFGSEKLVAFVNNAFFVVVILAFFGLLALGLPAVQPSNLVDTFHPELLINALPVMVLAFVHHNVIPTVSRQLGYDKKKLQKAILFGTAIPFAMFLLWNVVVLGIGPIASIDSTEPFTDRSSFDTVGVLASAGGGENGGIVATELAEVFSTAALVTSFIGFFIGLSDFLKDYIGDALQGDKNKSITTTSSIAYDAAVAIAVTAPSAGIAILNPSIFVSALDIAGTYGTTLLFLMVPALMSLVMRSRTEEDEYESFVGPFGTTPAVLCIVAASALILEKISQSFV
jgi:tyrosine-specific transport protein